MPRAHEHQVPPGLGIAFCRSCGAAIYWVTTTAGMQLPISGASIQEHDGTRWGVSHFIDCPQGAGWSRKKGKRHRRPK
jgi:hypothetical protein